MGNLTETLCCVCGAKVSDESCEEGQERRYIVRPTLLADGPEAFGVCRQEACHLAAVNLGVEVYLQKQLDKLRGTVQGAENALTCRDDYFVEGHNVFHALGEIAELAQTVRTSFAGYQNRFDCPPIPF